MALDLGELAYTAYGEARHWKTFANQPMPPWRDQLPELREAWRAAADAVRMVIEGRLTSPLEYPEVSDRADTPEQ